MRSSFRGIVRRETVLSGSLTIFTFEYLSFIMTHGFKAMGIIKLNELQGVKDAYVDLTFEGLDWEVIPPLL
jgi:hypothetical protein